MPSPLTPEEIDAATDIWSPKGVKHDRRSNGDREMRELVGSLRHADQHSQQRVLGSRIFGEAADAIERLQAENERLRGALREIRDADQVEMALDPEWPSRIARAAISPAP